MEQILFYYNNHINLEQQGIAIDWKKVANTMAVLVQSLIDKPSMEATDST